MRLANKVALISGGGTGIGAATARLFALEGAKVIVTGRRREPIDAVAAEIGAIAVAGDTSDSGHANEAVAAAVTAFGGIDIVVASAGLAFVGSAGDIEDAHWQRTLDVNLTGPLVLVRAASARTCCARAGWSRRWAMTRWMHSRPRGASAAKAPTIWRRPRYR